ncbi:type VII secretion protein EccE [Longispora fulva]|uniref:Type VII secretion protein EccE n=1 Tax=Longispora fulva TaxID=619741 RepID=A0A8J7GEU7_9ACTN|nr:type VII secretion protein EccE [Longispora fulva]MBG6139338.1 type VII secretion protein EccE [Longispora fulva]GIG58835.1 type VII secretion protein EccE [Longispora fulva]
MTSVSAPPGYPTSTGGIYGVPTVHGGPRPSDAAAVAPRPPRRPGMILGVPAVHLLVWQLAAAGVLAALAAGNLLVLVVAGVLAAVTLGLTAVRIERRWLYRWLGTWLRYVLRDRVAQPAPYVDPRAALLEHLSPSTLVTSVDVDGAGVGVVEHLAGVTALLELGPIDTGLIAESPVTLPSPAALLPPADPNAPPLTLQLLIQAVPAPALTVGSGVVASSYRQLTEGRIPAVRRAWLAIRLGRDGATHSDADLRQALGSAARRLVHRLRQDDVLARALDRDEVLTAVGSLAHLPATNAPVRGSATVGSVGVASVGAASPGPIGQETWNAWWSGDIPQVTVKLRRWADPGTDGGSRLLSVALASPCLATTVSLAARRVDVRPADLPPGSEAELIAVELGVRLAAPDLALLDTASAALAANMGAIGATVERLGGEQAAGLAATLPLGGFLQ